MGENIDQTLTSAGWGERPSTGDQPPREGQVVLPVGTVTLLLADV
ncbi:MAG: hypothetical protein QOD72_3054, partial [Acidimicrobiaceae bacterium]|nr:hypothetical protein [Acidimicrobiaceae bacterium]